ncbi:hypothetical protein FHX82_004294, partial [Amycolatopsis bartoniae]|nr:hypothetical protein [Amycolatopsis bartoniae]
MPGEQLRTRLPLPGGREKPQPGTILNG